MLLKKKHALQRLVIYSAAFTVFMIFSAAGNVLAAPCDLKNHSPATVRHDLTLSHCELCSYGYITVVIANPYEGVDMIDMTIVENLGFSGLTFAAGAPNPVTYSINGGLAWPGGPPDVSGALLTWTAAQIPPFARLEYENNPNSFNTIAITFAVTRSVDPEGLIGADRRIEARLTYDTDDQDCFPGFITETTGVDILPLHEPVPEVTKTARNPDANQSSWSDTVYGHVNDDVIWRVQVSNAAGSASLQDLRFDDFMANGNLQINYACPTAEAAAVIAANNGIDPGGGGCIAVGNSINDFDVDNPFGNPGGDIPDLVDAAEGGSAYVYLVGKIPSSPNGSCVATRTNSISDLQWGCEADPPAGGITTTSSGYMPSGDSADLSTLSNSASLTVETAITGINSSSQPAGSKATVRITIHNTSGGTIKGIYLRDILPVEYVVDPTFTPTVAATGAYGAYPGMTDRIEWTNPVAPVDVAAALSNTAPEFRLFSSTVHPYYADQLDLLRHGDRLVITFRIVLVRPQSYDKTADLDVRIEAPDSDPPATDPANAIELTNQLFVDFENFCNPGVVQHPAGYPIVTTHASRPEDLDIDINGSELTFILTSDPNQTLPLTVNLTNRGGHDAADYAAYVSFGRTIHVAAAPAGCTVTSNPPPLAVWRRPAPIPSDATVYQCSSGTVSPGQTVAYHFEVLKSTNAADIAADDLTFRADVAGQITLSDATPLWFPTPTPRADGVTDAANNYSLDGIRAKVIGFNLLKSQHGACTENNPPPAFPDLEVQIGEECTYHIESGGWFGFNTPGFVFIAVQDIQVFDQLPNGQGYVSSTNPVLTSTAAIQGISLNPASLAPLSEVIAPDWLNWTFNQTARIQTIDEWFRVYLTARLLNDPINSSALPNRHAELSSNVLNATFEAVFNNEGVEEIYNLGPGTVGYPRQAVRRIDLTVTEPRITVVKEVCNESLYGAGPACSNWVTLAADGDAYNSYLYRLTLTNEASSSGVRRAPAYDVIVRDQLDASDLAYILPFAADGLDNDGDGATGAADADGEGSISDNIVDNGSAAQITFAYTHSNALLRIDPGQSVVLYYRVDYDDDAAPLQTFVNSSRAVYDSLAGVAGNQSAPQRPSGDIGGAREYISPNAAAAVQIIPVITEPKRIIRLSSTPLAVGPVTQQVSIGEEIEYRLSTLLPVALLRNFVIRDELPTGLRCAEAPAVNLDAAPYAAANFVPGGIITPTCSDGMVEWQFGDQRVTTGTIGNRYDFRVAFIARVENTVETNDGNVISNGHPATSAYARYIDESAQLVELTFGQVDVTIGEPRIELAKTFAVTNADAADILTVTVTADNTGTASAFNLRVLDDLTGRNLTYTGNIGGANPPDTVDVSTLGSNRPIFRWNAPNGIAAGQSLSFSFDVRVDQVVQPQEVLDNIIQAAWTSLPDRSTALNSAGQIGVNGTATGMRIGAIPNAGHSINDYEAQAGAQLVVPALDMSKIDLDPAQIPAIGVHKPFRVEIRLPEGTTRDVVVTDSLHAAGLSYRLSDHAPFEVTCTFEGIATINGLPPSQAAFTARPSDNASGSVVWDIGTVVTVSENDTSQSTVTPMIRIDYYARVNNDLDTDDGDALRNQVLVGSTHGETGIEVTVTAGTEPVTVREPLLTVTKLVSNVTRPGNDPVGGDVLEYVLTIPNSGTAEAFDVNVVDTLPAGMLLHAAFTSTALINGSPVSGFIAMPDAAPAGPLVWGRGNADGSLDIPAGQTLILTYRTVVVEVGGNLNNSVYVDWTSLNGGSVYERSGAGCPNWTAPNDYCAGPAVAVITTVDDSSFDKQITADTFDDAPLSTAVDAVVRVGDIVTYRLALNLRGGLTRGVLVQDQLPAGMSFIHTVSINGDTTPDYTPPAAGPGSNFAYAPITAANVPAAGQTGTLTWRIGDVDNDPFADPTTDTLVILYRAQILADSGLAQTPTMTLTNTAILSYAGGTPLADQAVLTVQQPVLSVTKSAAPTGGDTLLAADEIVTYTVEIANSGAAPAYDVLLTDIIPVGMRNGAATITMVSIELVLSGTALPNLDPTFNPATGLVTWNLDSGVAGQYAVAGGDTLRIVYQVQTDSHIGAGLTLTNSAQVQSYASFDDDDVPIVAGTSGTAQVYGPSNVASTTLTTAAAAALDKQNPGTPGISIGQPFSYRITVPAAPIATALHDVRILDNLGTSAADLRFVSVSKIAGSQPWIPVNSGSSVNLVIEDLNTGIEIPAGEQIVLEITVVAADTAVNVAGLSFHNTADYTHNPINGNDATRAPGGADTTADLTIVVADAPILQKSGPAAMNLGAPGAFTLDLHNPEQGALWQPTLTDRLPNTPEGGMCSAGPTNVTARIFAADRVTPVSPVLVQGSDFTVSVSGLPVCQWTLQMLSAAGAVASGQHLIVNYELALDPSTNNGVALTNIAGATNWFSTDPDAPGADPRVYSRTLTDGTPGLLDYQDAHTVLAETPTLAFSMAVVNAATGQDPGRNAAPGDRLRYTISVTNSGPVGLSDFTIRDELDRLNAVPAFAPGTLTPIVIPSGADASGSNPAGGAHGTGLLTVDHLNIGAQGQADDTLQIVYEATLAPVITSGTLVLNQAEITVATLVLFSSDDPDLPGEIDPTQTLIAAQPIFEVLKTATVLSGDPALLMAGETLRYTVTIRNIGSEDAVAVRLQDHIPAHTSYVAGSTTLNGVAVSDPGSGISPLENGMLIHTPDVPTAGTLRADPTRTIQATTVTFDVVVHPDVMDGLIIANQGFVQGSGAGSGAQPEKPSDDPGTPVPDDPTCVVVGNLPLLYAHKTVAIAEDFGSPGIADPGDVLRYTIAIYNSGAIPATGVMFSDPVPADTTYVANSLRINGIVYVSNGGISPLITGVALNSTDNPGPGIISAGRNAAVSFDVRVNADVPVGTLISNQGLAVSSELPPEPTDSDGIPSNGDQPTVIVVGQAQLLTITKEVVVPGGAALPGAQLEFILRVTNIGSLPATHVNVSDDLNLPLSGLVSYIGGSGTMDGLPAGVTFVNGVLRADYAAQFGDLPPGGRFIVRFRVQIDPGLEIGTTITNTGEAHYSDPTQTVAASVSIDVGGVPGSSALNGYVWHDADLDKTRDQGIETYLAGWQVTLYRGQQSIATVATDESGAYSFSALVPNTAANPYELRFHAAGAGSNSASLGYADSPFADGPQRISEIVVGSGGNLQNLNLPLQPNGAVYNSIVRAAVAGAGLALSNADTGALLPVQCFDDPRQQNQVTALDGFYKFDLNFSLPDCPAGGAYLISVTPPPSGYRTAPSQTIPPASGAATEPFSIPACPGSAQDMLPATGFCEVNASPVVPPVSVAPRTAGTVYYLHLLLGNDQMPGHSQIFNNPIPLDPVLDGAVAITKTAAMTNVSKASLVPYTITVTNLLAVPLYDIAIVDRLPAGFKYVSDSARLNGGPAEPQLRGRELVWEGRQLQLNEKLTLTFLLVVGSGVGEGEYVNRAQVIHAATGEAVSGEATATVRVIPDPDMDCTDVIGKVFDDRDLDGQQGKDEPGLAGVRVVTARGLIATTDEYGRFHITCAAIPDEDRGSNFILKVDERSLPSGFRLTTENPRVQRVTRGKMMRFNFGATIHRVVRIDVADGVFEPGTRRLRMQWISKFDQLLDELHKAPSILRLSYLADVERKGLVDDRLDMIKEEVTGRWKKSKGGYRLIIETEVFWRRGAPVAGR